MFDELLRDATHALRMFRKNLGFTTAAVAALALGIGANVAIFSVVNAVLLKPAPFPQPDRLVIFENTTPRGPFTGASPAKFQHYRAQGDVVRDVSAYRFNAVNLTGGGFPEQVDAGSVSTDFFRLFGARVERGRTFTGDEDRPNGEKVVVLGHALWERRFGRDPQVVGRAIPLGGEPHTVVGILGAEFDVRDFGATPDLWIPFQIDPNTSDQGHYFQVAGRLAPGVTLAQAQARMKLSAEEYRRKYPDALPKDNGFSVVLLRDALVRNARPTLWLLLGAVAFVLLIACANVANLLLVRAASRTREIAIRTAMGAHRGRIVRQLLTESALLSLAGGALGLALGVVGIRVLLAVNTADLPRVGDAGAAVVLDWRVAVFTLITSLATGLLFGMVPALHVTRADLSAAFKEGGSRSGTSEGQHRTRAALVVAEVALAVVLVVGAALLIRTAVALGRVDPGFDTTHVLTMRMTLGEPRFERSESVERLVRTGVERVQAIPGVAAVSAACCVPLEGGYGLPFVIAGRPLEDRPFHGGGGWLTVSPGYFDVFRIAVRRGRTFTERDTSQAPPVVVINEALAREFFPKQDAVGQRLIIGRGGMREFETESEREIVGIVGDVRDGALNDDPGPQMYVPQAQVPDAANALNVRISPLAWVVRTQVPPATLQQPIADAIRQATGLPVSDIRAMDQVVSRSTSRQRFNMWLMSVFGSASLLLAAIGVYGLVAYSVQQRTQEFGVRLALGARAEQVKAMVLAQGARLALIGLAAGIAGALGLARVMGSFLFGVRAWDPFVFALAPAVLGLTVLAATWIPARRASSVDPVQALRCE
jgi:predicted permease